LGTAAALGVALVAPAAAHAQAQTQGTRFGVEADIANHSTGFGVGAFVKFHLAEISEHPITGRATFDYYFPSSSNFGGFSYHYWEVAGDGLFDITNASSKIKPYVGAGLTYWHASFGGNYCSLFSCGSTGGVGLDILGGINFMANSKLMPFVELKLDARSGGDFIIKGGIHF
jgi:hypothetical protein